MFLASVEDLNFCITRYFVEFFLIYFLLSKAKYSNMLCEGIWSMWKATGRFHALWFPGHVHSENVGCIFVSVLCDDEMQVHQ